MGTLCREHREKNIIGMFFGMGGNEGEEYSRNVHWVRGALRGREGGREEKNVPGMFLEQSE